MSQRIMRIVMSGPFRDYILGRVARGGYVNPSEYIRELVRRDQETQAYKRLRDLIHGTEVREGVATHQATLTGSERVTIPQEIRDRLGLKAGGQGVIRRSGQRLRCHVARNLALGCPCKLAFQTRSIMSREDSEALDRSGATVDTGASSWTLPFLISGTALLREGSCGTACVDDTGLDARDRAAARENAYARLHGLARDQSHAHLDGDHKRLHRRPTPGGQEIQAKFRSVGAFASALEGLRARRDRRSVASSTYRVPGCCRGRGPDDFSNVCRRSLAT